MKNNLQNWYKNRVVMLICIIVLSMVIIFLRRPDIFLHPGLWAEDGFWLTEGYNHGLFGSFFETKDGYIQGYSRIVTAIALMFDLHYFPLIVVLFALIAYVSPLVLILSPQARSFFKTQWGPYVLLGVYLFLPNMGEMYINLTNAQWFLALSAVMITLLPVPKRKLLNILERGVLLMSGISGPFTFFLLPISIIQWFRSKNTWSGINALIVVATSIFQIIFMVISRGDERLLFGGISFSGMYSVIVKQIIWGSLVGKLGVIEIEHMQFGSVFFALSFIVATILVVFFLYNGAGHFRLMLAYAGIIFLASIATSTASKESLDQVYEILSHAYGTRYWFIPMLTFLSIVCLGTARKNPKIIQFSAWFFVSCALIIHLMPHVLEKRFFYDSLPDRNFSVHIDSFLKTTQGETYRIPINPEGWNAKLIRK